MEYFFCFDKTSSRYNSFDAIKTARSIAVNCINIAAINANVYYERCAECRRSGTKRLRWSADTVLGRIDCNLNLRFVINLNVYVCLPQIIWSTCKAENFGRDFSKKWRLSLHFFTFYINHRGFTITRMELWECTPIYHCTNKDSNNNKNRRRADLVSIREILFPLARVCEINRKSFRAEISTAQFASRELLQHVCNGRLCLRSRES